MDKAAETLEGYVVDLACVRRNPRTELFERARAHSRECVLMGHCVESGYALIGENGEISVLDTHATPHIVRIVEAGSRERGIRLRAIRERHGDELQTIRVEEIE